MPVKLCQQQNRIIHSWRERLSLSFCHVRIFINFIPVPWKFCRIYWPSTVGRDILKPSIETASSSRKMVSAFTTVRRHNTLSAWNWKPGRLPIETPASWCYTEQRQEKVAEEFVNFRAETSTPKAINLSDLKSATRNDATVQALAKAVQTGKWH